MPNKQQKIKVYFTASLRGMQFYSQYYKEIYQTLQELNCEHLDEEIFTLNRLEYYTSLEKGGKKIHSNLVERKMKAIHNAQICIFEVSAQSLSIGLQIQKSIDYHKPTIIMYLQENTPYFLDGMTDDKLIILDYRPNNIKEVLQNALKLAFAKKDNRFNFYISMEHLTYLEEASRNKNITKSTYLRNLLEQDRLKLKS